ncbi:MAG: hypothetical protein VB071_03180 [Lawsonibacter sp.]|nr:hypothetical protein [Lawsonibacter sp.]
MMKSNFKGFFSCLLIGTVLCMFSACQSDTVQNEAALSGEEIASDRPTVPSNTPEEMEYLYDFRFSERYDDHITDDFSIELPNEGNLSSDTFFLFEKYKNESAATKEYTYSGDGIVPYTYKRYWYAFEKGSLMIGTDYFETDQVEYISYLWSDKEGVKTNENVAVGSTEKELLSAYTDDLYYIDRDEALSEINLSAISILGYQEGSTETLDEAYNFDYAYMWQPFTPEKNDIRDITFYIKGGKVIAIEMINPFELRHVYGYDRDAGLRYTEEQRKN